MLRFSANVSACCGRALHSGLRQWPKGQPCQQQIETGAQLEWPLCRVLGLPEARLPTLLQGAYRIQVQSALGNHTERIREVKSGPQ